MILKMEITVNGNRMVKSKLNAKDKDGDILRFEVVSEPSHR